MVKIMLVLGSILGALSVSIGAFGAHKFAPYLKSIDRVETFETAVRYQFYHTFALLISAILLHVFQNKMFVYAGWSFVGGIVIFFRFFIYSLCN